MPDRLAQLLGVVALAAADRAAAGDGPAAVNRARAASDEGGVAGPEAAALVHLTAWPGTSVGALAAIVGRSQPATVRLVDRLVARGLVERGPGPDRRTLALQPTAAGRRAADAFLADRGAALTPLLAGLDAADRAALEPLLERIVAGLAADRRGAVRVCRQCDRDVCRSGPGCPLDHTVDAAAAADQRVARGEGG